MTDPLLPLLAAPVPAGPSQAMRWRQGTVMSFDQNTLENTVDVGGTTLANLPILGVAEAASIAAGSVVGLLAIESTEGTITYAILGRLVTPATDAATDAITRLSQGVATGFVAATESTTSDPFTDLTTLGPTVTITVRASGKVLLFLGATIKVNSPGAQLWGGFMSAQISGANTVAPNAVPGNLGYFQGTGSAVGISTEWSFARMIPLTDLTPGETTFTAKYAVGSGLPGETAQFRNRSIAVFAL